MKIAKALSMISFCHYKYNLLQKPTLEARKGQGYQMYLHLSWTLEFVLKISDDKLGILLIACYFVQPKDIDVYLLGRKLWSLIGHS